jgi:hypothetical protein
VELGYIKIQMICVDTRSLLEIVANGGEGSFFIPVNLIGADLEGDGVDFVHDEWFCNSYSVKIIT